MAVSVIQPPKNAVLTAVATGNAVNVRYDRSGNVVTVQSISNARLAMTAAETYLINSDMLWKPAYRVEFEGFCRNGVEAYFLLDPDAQSNQFTITPRQNIANGASMAFSFSYITKSD